MAFITTLGGGAMGLFGNALGLRAEAFAVVGMGLGLWAAGSLVHASANHKLLGTKATEAQSG
jgi:hypothetical protein